MTINQIKDMADFVGQFQNGFQANPAAPAADVITLTAAYNAPPTTNAFVWDIWRRDFNETPKYPFVNEAKPTLMLFAQGTVDKTTYSSGIAFPINLQSTIKKITVDTQQKLITIDVKKSAFFWRYNRKNNESIRKVFRHFSDNDFKIGASVTNQMDSQTPSHPKGGQLGGGHEG